MDSSSGGSPELFWVYFFIVMIPVIFAVSVWLLYRRALNAVRRSEGREELPLERDLPSEAPPSDARPNERGGEEYDENLKRKGGRRSA